MLPNSHSCRRSAIQRHPGHAAPAAHQARPPDVPPPHQRPGRARQPDDSLCTSWAPAAPVRLYYATRGEQAVNANTFDCQASFAAHGAKVPVLDLGTPNNEGPRHLGPNATGTRQIVRWFSQLAQHRTQPA